MGTFRDFLVVSLHRGSLKRKPRCRSGSYVGYTLNHDDKRLLHSRFVLFILLAKYEKINALPRPNRASERRQSG